MTGDPRAADTRAGIPVGDQSGRGSDGQGVHGEAAAIHRQLSYLAWLMDESIRIPVVGVRLGLDGLLGLIPGVGDLISAGISTYIIGHAANLGVPRVVLLRMGFNTAIDFVIGAIPLVGDLFDIGWKANRRNVGLLLQHLENPKQSSHSSWLAMSGLLAGIGLAIAGLIYGSVSLAGLVWRS